MANLDDLKTAIKQAIKPNNAQEITGQTMQNTLLQMVDDLGVSTEIAKGTIDLNGSYDTLDQYNSIDKKGWYVLSPYNNSELLKDWGGFMLVTADDMGHVMHQFIFSDYIVMDGEIGGHQDGTPSIVVRTYNVSSPSIKDIPKGTWGKWTNYFGLSRQTGYAECTSTADDAEKHVAFSDNREFALSLNCRILVKMEQGNNAANPTMNIDNSDYLPLYYNGSPASATNTWEAGDILDVFYDGTNYQAFSFGNAADLIPLALNGGRLKYSTNSKTLETFFSAPTGKINPETDKLSFYMMGVRSRRRKDENRSNKTLKRFSRMVATTATASSSSTATASTPLWNNKKQTASPLSADITTHGKSYARDYFNVDMTNFVQQIARKFSFQDEQTLMFNINGKMLDASEKMRSGSGYFFSIGIAVTRGSRRLTDIYPVRVKIIPTAKDNSGTDEAAFRKFWIDTITGYKFNFSFNAPRRNAPEWKQPTKS